jgi:glyoxylase-like metal-dependent hydrolase (beta-lactamase superfamily II)
MRFEEYKMYYQIEKLDGYYRIGSAEAVFSYLVVGRQQAMLIDTGYGLGDLKAAVDSLTSLPLIIVNT